MQPPAKRLRLLQSVEVEEDNPDYIKAKQEQQERFKSKLESLFEKYGNMHESMSDEIDLRTNKVVVDRGHLRRLQRQSARNETSLVDDLGLFAGNESDHDSEQDHEDDDSADELAPTQQPRPNCGKKTHTSSPLLPSRTAASTVAPLTSQQVADTPNQAANLLQFVQFPQTPAGQQAQAAFVSTLAQTINQAVHQVVAPLFMGMSPITPSLHLQPLSAALPAAPTPVTMPDVVAPATDPKWYFPPLPAMPAEHQVTQPSPTPLPAKDWPLDATPAQPGHLIPSINQETDDMEVALETVQSPSAQDLGGQHIGLDQSLQRTSPRVAIRTYVFTEDEDKYISRKKVLYRKTWIQIRNSKAKWKSWPPKAFQNRWEHHLKDKNLHLNAPTSFRSANSDVVESAESVDSMEQVQTHRLPTPSSIAQEESHTEVEDLDDKPEEEPKLGGGCLATPMSSSAHCDNDDFELLSPAGVAVDETQLDRESINPIQQDDVLPSIETTHLVGEDTLQKDLLDNSLVEDNVPTPIPSPIQIKAETPVSSPTLKRRRNPKQIPYTVPSDSDAATNDIAPSQRTEAPKPFICTTCQKTFKTATWLKRHLNHPPADHTATHSASHTTVPTTSRTIPTQRNPSIDLIDADEIHAPSPPTPHIKREPSTPAPTSSFLLAATLKTPAPAFQHLSTSSASGSKSTSKLDRKSYLKQVKQSWTRKPSPAPRGVAKRKSLSALALKRVWDDGASGSEDELA